MEQTILMRANCRDVVAILLGLILVGCVADAAAGPVAVTHHEGVKITLYDDPCTSDVVSNLPYKAEWVEKGKTYTGCWGLHPMGLVMTYFKEDRSVALIPARVFEKVTGV